MSSDNFANLKAYFSIPGFFAFLLTASILSISHFKVSFPIILLERFLPGYGFIEIALLALYAAFITRKLLDTRLTAIWRLRIWSLFSIVFFLQLILGLLGNGIFLMTGELHLPIPAIILAGPIFRGGSYFMPILFSITLLFVGPAWCSYLCYLGSWDLNFSRNRNKPKSVRKQKTVIRFGMLVLVALGAALLRYLGVSSQTAGILAVVFAFVGIFVMFFFSRTTGAMVHCLTYCPIGILADFAGKISPFRLKIKDECSTCRLCTITCRYDALNIEDLERKKPGITCTLCGDCLSACKDSFITYSFFGFQHKIAYPLFIVTIVTFHACFLGLARL